MNKLSSAVLGTYMMAAGCAVSSNPSIQPPEGCGDVRVVSAGEFVSKSHLVVKNKTNEARCEMGQCIFEQDPTEQFKQCSTEMSSLLSAQACADQNAALALCAYNDGREAFGCLPKVIIPIIKDRVKDCLQSGKFIGLIVDPEHMENGKHVSCTENSASYCKGLGYLDENNKAQKVPLVPPCDMERKMGNSKAKEVIVNELKAIAELSNSNAAGEAAMMCATQTLALCDAQAFTLNHNLSKNPIGWCIMGLNEEKVMRCDDAFLQCLGFLRSTVGEPREWTTSL